MNHCIHYQKENHFLKCNMILNVYKWMYWFWILSEKVSLRAYCQSAAWACSSGQSTDMAALLSVAGCCSGDTFQLNGIAWLVQPAWNHSVRGYPCRPCRILQFSVWIKPTLLFKIMQNNLIGIFQYFLVGKRKWRSEKNKLFKIM